MRFTVKDLAKAANVEDAVARGLIGYLQKRRVVREIGVVSPAGSKSRANLYEGDPEVMSDSVRSVLKHLADVADPYPDTTP